MRGAIQYPAPFGRDATPEEAKIAELDAKTGASLKVISHEIIIQIHKLSDFLDVIYKTFSTRYLWYFISFQLTILNEKGRIWTMVAGGGASVIYADTIVDMGGVKELANYGKA